VSEPEFTLRTCHILIDYLDARRICSTPGSLKSFSFSLHKAVEFSHFSCTIDLRRLSDRNFVWFIAHQTSAFHALPTMFPFGLLVDAVYKLQQMQWNILQIYNLESAV
jgi:hypothetical protein